MDSRWKLSLEEVQVSQVRGKRRNTPFRRNLTAKVCEQHELMKLSALLEMFYMLSNMVVTSHMWLLST